MAFYRFGAGGEAVPREEARKQPVHGGLAGMQRLTHRPVDHLHPRRLGGAGTDRRERLFRRKAEQSRGSRGRADVADGAGDVPAGVVVARPCGDGNPGLHLETGDERLDRGHTGDRDEFGRRGDGRPQRRAAVDRRAVGVEGVVEVEHVRGDPVGQRRVARARALAGTHDRRGSRTVACVQRADARADPFALGGGRTRDRAAEPVDQTPHRLVHHVGGKVVDSQRGREAGQRGAYRLLIGHRPLPSDRVCNTEMISVIQITWLPPRRTTTTGPPPRRGRCWTSFRARLPTRYPPTCCTRAPAACSTTSVWRSRAPRSPPQASPGRSAGCSAATRRPERSAHLTGCGSPMPRWSTESLAMHWISTTPMSPPFSIPPRRCTRRERRWPSGGGRAVSDLLAAHALGYELCRPGQQRALPRALRRGLAHDRHHRRTGVGDGRDEVARPRGRCPRHTA